MGSEYNDEHIKMSSTAAVSTQENPPVLNDILFSAFCDELEKLSAHAGAPNLISLRGMSDEEVSSTYRQLLDAHHAKLRKMEGLRPGSLRHRYNKRMARMHLADANSFLEPEKRAYKMGLYAGANVDRKIGTGIVSNRMAGNLTKAIRELSQRPVRSSVAAVSQPAMSKTAEVTYRGITFPGYNKPIASNRKGKKKMVLVKKGDKVRIVHFGQKGYQDFTQHKDKARRKNYLTRSAGIRNKSGQLTKDDPFSPNYWARRKLW